MAKLILIGALAFMAGAMATAAPFLVSGHFAHLEEVARKEGTMGPGITTALGLLLAPFGGGVSALIAVWIARRKKPDQPPSERP